MLKNGFVRADIRNIEFDLCIYIFWIDEKYESQVVYIFANRVFSCETMQINIATKMCMFIPRHSHLIQCICCFFLIHFV